MKKIINVAKDFSKTPGGRNITDGPHSGEEFREKFLEPLFQDVNATMPIEVNFDGAYGYATSFLEEAFGGLARKHGIEKVLLRFDFISTEEPTLIDEVRSYIEKCNE